MSKRHYSAQQKNFALQVLKEKAGDVALVSHLLAIPERTLFRWRKASEWQDWQDWQKNSPPPITPTVPITPTPSTAESISLTQTVFGMSYQELESALKAEYHVGPYTDIHHKILEHIAVLNENLSDDPDLAHRRALALSRLLDSALYLEDLVRREKPELSIIKYEYPDRTLHDLPYFDNAIHNRAEEAYLAVLEQAKRQYYAEQGKNLDSPFDYPLATRSPEEIIAEPFAPEDFTNEPKSYYAKLLMGKREFADEQAYDPMLSTNESFDYHSSDLFKYFPEFADPDYNPDPIDSSPSSYPNQDRDNDSYG